MLDQAGCMLPGDYYVPGSRYIVKDFPSQRHDCRHEQICVPAPVGEIGKRGLAIFDDVRAFEGVARSAGSLTVQKHYLHGSYTDQVFLRARFARFRFFPGVAVSGLP